MLVSHPQLVILDQDRGRKGLDLLCEHLLTRLQGLGRAVQGMDLEEISPIGFCGLVEKQQDGPAGCLGDTLQERVKGAE